jgi:hypothetical protein
MTTTIMAAAGVVEAVEVEVEVVGEVVEAADKVVEVVGEGVEAVDEAVEVVGVEGVEAEVVCKVMYTRVYIIKTQSNPSHCRITRC